MTLEQLQALRQRNEMRAHNAIVKLGKKWLLHPSNRVTRKPVELGAAGGAR